jgi:hypothetical protein
MSRACVAAMLLVGATLPLAADRDFLTTDEADQVRLVQEPNARLQLYVQFAAQRIDLIEHLVSKPQAGRTTLIHEALEDYTKIIETIDTVADDALLRGERIEEGIAAVAEAQEKFLAVLQKVEESEPRDMARFRFALETAIETTEDSLEINREDLRERSANVAEREKQERRQMEELMTPEHVRERKEQAAETEKKEEEQKRKTPTLYRKDEKKTDKR